MRNLKLTIEYDGKNYCGWQIQKGHKSQVTSHKSKSIQEVIEDTLRKILQEKVRLIASGRTDARVGALAQVANFKTASNITPIKLQKALNSLLPDDIVINNVERVPLDFHSRFSAKSKIYRYFILNQPYPSVFLNNRVYFYRYPLDIKLMRRGAHFLLGRHDFKSFCASGSSAKSTIRTIKKISIGIKRYTLYLPCRQADALRSRLIIIDIEADGFLYNMARNIAGNLIEVGRGKLSPGDLLGILRLRDRRRAGPCAPAGGLYLLKVLY
jgi:tRNA pseudouridine38-40 synthase